MQARGRPRPNFSRLTESTIIWVPSDAELGGAGRAEEAAARVVGSGLLHAMRSSRRGGGRRADHPFPLVPRDPENLDRDHQTLKRQTAYLASALNDPTELNALHAAQTSATPDASEVLNSLGQYLGVPGFERGPSSGVRTGSAEERPPPLAKGVLPEVAPGDHEAYLREVASGWSAFTAANADRRARDVEDEAGGRRRRTAFDGCDDDSCATSGPSRPSSNGDLDRHLPHEDVPAMFFDDVFDLSDPAVFRRALCPDDDDDDDDDDDEASRTRAPTATAAPAVSSSSSHPPRRSRALFGLAAQARLGSYLDRIETSLVAAIGARSESFFEASARLHELDAFASETCEAIERTRRMLLDASTYATCARESVASLHSKRANLAALADAFERLATVRECREDLDVLRRAGDYGGSLEACEDVRRSIAAPSLRGLRCLEDVARHVGETEREVVDALVAEFVRAARVQPGSVGYVDTAGGDDDDDDTAGGGDWSPATTRAALAAVRAAARDAGVEGVEGGAEDEEEDDSGEVSEDAEDHSRRAGLGPGEASAADARESLLPPLLALTRGATDRPGRIADAMRAWGRAAAADARACVRAACVACIAAVHPGRDPAMIAHNRNRAEPESQPSGRDGIIQRAIGALPPSVFAVVVRAVTTSLAGHFARADIVRSAARHALGTAPLSERDDDGKKNDSFDDSFGTRTDECARAACAALPAGERAAASAAASDAVLALTDAAQGAVARAIASNASATRSFTLDEFSNVCDAADDFLERAERLGGGRRCLALRATVAAQCKDLFAARHAAFAAKLGVVLEAETWTPATPVPPEFQKVLEDLADLSSAAGGSEGNESGDASSHSGGDVAGVSKNVSDALVFPNTGDTVVPVAASLALLKMVRDHVAAAARFPSLAPTAVHKTAELLRVFNSRTSQLVLGAGAMRTAGLRSITAKHLALATESVRLFALVTPLASNALSPALPESRRVGLLAELDRTVADLAKHARELHAKTVGIMRERLAHHSSRLPTIWCSRVFTERSEYSRSSAGKEEEEEDDISSTPGEILKDAKGAKGPSEFASALGKEIGTLRRVIAGTLCARDAAAVFDEVSTHFDESLTRTLREASRSVAKEWRAKMGDRGEGIRGEGGAAEGGAAEGGAAEGGAAEGGAEGSSTREGDDASTATNGRCPSDEEVGALIALDGAALLECLGTLVKGGEGGDGAAGAPTLARFLSERA